MTDLDGEWTHARRLTTDLLRACSVEDLAFSLHPETNGPLWKQFRHIGWVHEAYLEALRTGHVVFDPSIGGYKGDASRDALLAYYESLDGKHRNVVSSVDPAARIDWFGETVSVEIHLVRLLTHETLHHGQFMLAWRALGHPFPESWASWGEA